MNENMLKNLNNLTRMLGADRLLSPEDVIAIKETIVGILADNKREIEGLTGETRKVFNSVLNDIQTELDKYIKNIEKIAQEVKFDTTEAIKQAVEEMENVKKLCKEVMDNKPKDGDDADEEKIVADVLAQIKLPEYKEVILDDGGQIVDKINALPVNEENQIDASHIKNLPKVKSVGGGITQARVLQLIQEHGGGGGGSGSGDVVGPASATDNAIARFDTTTGKLIQNSAATIDDSGILSTTSAIISGTNGAGHINLRHQASDATATGQSTALFADSNGDIKYKNDGDFYTTLKTSLNTADRTYTFPDATGTLFMLPSLTAGSVLFSDGSTISQNNSKFFWDIINFRLGIGTATPAYALEVRGGSIYNNSTGSGFFITNRGANTNFSGFQFNTNQVTQWTIGGRNDSTENLYFFADVSGVIRATLTTAGLFGVGATPSAVLTLKAGTATASTAPLKFTAGTVLTTPEAGTLEFTNSETGLTFTAVSTRRQVVLDTATQTLTNKTLTSPEITTSITTASTSFTAFAGATTLLTIGGTGASASLFVPSTLDTTSSITGAIRTSGGISAAKAANIGTSLTVGTTIELGNASDTTLSRSSAGVIAVEGVVIPSISSTNTLTNKFITPQVQSVADAGGTLTPVSITNDVVIATALSQATTIAAPTGSPVQGERLVIRLKDNGTARALTWNAIYRAIGVTIPTTTVISKTVYCGFIYNSTDTKWDCVAVAQEA